MCNFLLLLNYLSKKKNFKILAKSETNFFRVVISTCNWIAIAYKS